MLAAGTFSLNSNTGILLDPGATGTFDVSSGNLTLASTNVISDPVGSLTKTGAGTLTLSAADTYTGTTIVNGGILSVTNPDALGTGDIVVTAGTLSLDLGGAQLADTAPMTLNGAGTGGIGNSALYEAGTSGTDTVTNAITLGSGSSIGAATGGTLALTGGITNASFLTTFTGGGTISESGAITGTGGLTEAGGIGILAGTNTYTGATNVNSGILSITNAGGLGNGTSNTSSVTVANDAELDLSNVTLTASPALYLYGTGVSGNGALYEAASSGTGTLGSAITLNGPSTIGAATGSTLALTGGITNAGFLTTFAGGGDISESNVISGTGGVTMSGTGTLTLSGANTFTGNTTIASGTLSIPTISAVGDAGPLGESSTVFIGSGSTEGTLLYTGSSNGSSAVSFSIGGAGGTIENIGDSTLTLSGNIANTGSTGSLTFETDAVGSNLIIGTLSGSTISNGGQNIVLDSAVTVGTPTVYLEGLISGTGGLLQKALDELR